ncbi:MAG: hypothetical protein ABSB96_08385 [Gaiellaceae bacterium]
MREGRWTIKRELLVLTAIAAACLSLRLFFALRSATMVMIPDEYIYSEIARSLAHEGAVTIRGASAGFPALLYPISIAPFWGLFDVDTAYRLSQVFNAVCASLAALPAYLLCRRLGFRPLLRLGIPTLAIAVPGLTFTSYVMADSLAYLLALSAFAVGVHAMTRPGWRLELAFISLAGLAAFTRIQYLFLFAVFPMAALLLEPRRPLRTMRRFRLTFGIGAAVAALALALGLGSLLGYYRGVLNLDFHPLELVRWIGSDTYVLVFAVGAFVVPGALIGIARALTKPRFLEDRAFAVLALLTTASLLIEAGFYASNGASRVQERYLLLLLPLIGLAFGIAVEHKRDDWLPAAAISTGLTLAILSYPLSAYNTSDKVQDSPTLTAVVQVQDWFGSGNAALAVATLAIALLAIAVAATARPRLVLPLGLALSLAFLTAGSAIAGHHFRQNSNRVAKNYLPRNKSAIDQLGIDRLTYLRISPSSRSEVVELMFWNRSISKLAGLADTGGVDVYGFTSARIDRSGRLLIDGAPPHRPVVIDRFGARSTFGGGQKLLAEGAFEVLKPDPELRADFIVHGLFWDGWLSARGTATIWPDASLRSRGVLHLDFTAPEDSNGATLRIAGLSRPYTIALVRGERRTLEIPVDVRGRARLKFESNTAELTPDGRFVSVRARIWFVRATPAGTNVAPTAGRYKAQ